MSDISFFSTQIAQTSAQAGGQQTALSGAQSGVTAAGSGPGNAFWQFLFSLTGDTINTGEIEETDEISEEQKDILTQIIQNPDKVLNEAALKISEGKPLSLPELSLLLQEQDDNMPVEFKELSFEESVEKLNTLNRILNDMISVLSPESQSNPFAQTLLDRLQHRIEKLQTSLETIEQTKEEQVIALISLGLTPAEITDVTERIREVEEKIGRRLTPEDIVAGVGGILIPPPDEEDIALKLKPKPDPEPTDELAEILNDIAVGGEDPLEISDTQNFAFEDQNPANRPVTPARPATQNPVLFEALTQLTEPTDDLAAQLNAVNVGAGEQDEEIPSYEGLDIIARMSADMLDPSGTLQQTVSKLKTSFAELIQSQSGGDLQTPQGFFTALFDGTALSADQDLAAILPMTASAQAAHSVTSIPQAGHSHPATQTVAAHVSKMAQDGTPKSMRIQLDPPELGRVNVTLEFGPENTAKVHVLAEKPETLSMLQRDATLLERALQSTGLNTDSGSLSFELAEDNNAFNPKDNNNGQENNGRGTGNDAQTDMDIIDASVDWHIDPDTGITHYNLLA